MYLTTPVGIPDVKGITYLSKNGTEYVRYAEERKYDKDKKYTRSKHKSIGKREIGRASCRERV